MKNGISSNYCYDVLQDKYGYIWVATLNGVNRFNGNKWQHFLQQSPTENHRIQSNWVVDICSDSYGNIWMNTIKGISRYNPKTKKITRFSQPVKGWGKIECLSDSEIVISSWTGIDRYRIKGTKIVLLKHYKQSKGNTFQAFFQDKKGTLWACPEDHPSLFRISKNGKRYRYIRQLYLDNHSISPVVHSITSYSGDTLLLSTKKHGLLKYDPKTNRAFELSGFIPKGLSITCAYRYRLSNHSILFIGTADNGLYAVDLSTNQVYHYSFNLNNPSGIIANRITAISGDNNLGIWIATTKGISYFHPSLQKNKHYLLYNNPVIPEDVALNAVIPSDNHQFLMGTENNGLYLYHPPTTRTSSIALPELNNGQISSMLRISTDEIVIGSNKGLFIYSEKSKKCKSVEIPYMIKEIGILNLKSLENGYTGICTTRGPVVYHFGKKELLYSNLEKTDRYYCKDLCLIGKQLWSLRLFNGYELIDLTTRRSKDQTPEQLLSKPINFQNFVRRGNYLIVATSEGLILQNLNTKQSAEILTVKNGLEGDLIEQVYYRRKNDAIYYTTTTGLFRYFPKQRSSRPVTYFENYQQKWYNQLMGLRNGTIIYTISNYFITYNPELPFHTTRYPSVKPESIFVNGEERPLNQRIIKLNNDEKNILIQFAGLVYPQSDKNRWYYRLSGSSGNQFTVVNADQIHLTNLNPGNYELEVYSTNNEGKKSPVITIASFEIAPPFYASWWFLLLGIVIILTAIYLIYNFRKRQQERLLQIRNQISRDLHDELGAQVSSISIMSQLLIKNTVVDKKSILENITNYSSQISTTINDIIWNINPHSDSVDELIKKMMRHASEVLESAGINYHVNIPNASTRKTDIKNQVKYHVYLIFKEALNNCVKYSGAKLVNITLEHSETTLTLIISDNGIGFDPEKESTGNGIRNMRFRARDINASIAISSHPEKGTDIHLKIPLK